TAPVTATMTVNTTAPHTAPASPSTFFSPKLPWQPLLIASAILFLLALFKRTRRRLVFAALLFFLTVGVFAGCGGGSSTPPPIATPGTAPGTYDFTVTPSAPGPNAGLAVVSTQTTVTATVQ